MKLEPPDDTFINTVSPLCSLGFSVICWVFVRASFLQNPEKLWKFMVDRRLFIM